MIYVLRQKMSSNITQVQPSGGSTETAEQRRAQKMSGASKNIFKTLLMVFFMFILCWTWGKVFYLLYNLGVQVNFDSAIYYIGNCLGAMNQMVNPIIYVAQYKAFQTAARKLFCKNVKVHPGENSVNGTDTE